MTAIVDELEAMYAEHGGQSYGEEVTLLEHSLLTAAAAETAGAGGALISACLLHDVGHLLAESDDEHGVHDHGDLAGDYLAGYFTPAVSEPVRLHIEAKRYLVATEPKYHDHLSGPSQRTLRTQGGPMTTEECRRFEANQFATDAVRLRRWEDAEGKTSGSTPPPWSRFRRYLEEVVLR